MVARHIRRYVSSDERGAETVQLAMVFPLTFILVFSIVQLCLIAYFTVQLSTACEQASWSIDVDELQKCSGTQAACDMATQYIVSAGSNIDSSRLFVSNVVYVPTTAEEPGYRQSTSIKSNNVLQDEDGERYTLSTITRESAAGYLEFDVTYRIPSIINLPGLSNLEISKHVKRERVQLTRMEIR